MSHTIVSCYYLLPNNKKRSIPDYMVWISNFLRYCSSPIVMFSDGEIADAMDTLRKTAFPDSKNWLLIRRPLDQLMFNSREQLDYFNQVAINEARVGITADVFRIWANKAFLTKEIAEKNPFNTSSFVWCDAGCWRDERIARQYGSGWPRKQLSALSMTWMDDSLREVRKIRCPSTLEDCVKEYSPVILKTSSIAGAIFGGSLECIQTLCEVFPKVLDICIKNKIYVGTDQQIFAFSVLWLESRMPVDFYDKYRQPVPDGTDEWFLFQTIL
jgi:hypothetical protein